MTETRSLYDVTIERDEDGLPTRLLYSPSTPVYPAVTLDSHEPAAATDARREALAAYAHEAWSGWMEYLFSKSFLMADDHVRIPAELVERWARQMKTAYADLPEDEKESDRAEADKMLALMPAASRDASLTAFVDDLLDVLQEIGGMSAEWCETKLQAYETLLREG